MHLVQKLLIKRLVEENGRSYSSLTKGYDSKDNIAFHLKQLISGNLIEKRDDQYYITPEGINILNTFQKTDLQDNSFKMFFVGIVCRCGEEYLIKPHTNTKDIFYSIRIDNNLSFNTFAPAKQYINMACFFIRAHVCSKAS